MISEKEFATLYTSFWSSAIPLAETAVRAMNLRVDRVYEPLEADCPVRLNGFVNELAFRLVESLHHDVVEVITSEIIRDVYGSTETYIKRLSRPAIPSSPSEREAATRDAVVIANRLAEMIGHARGTRSIAFRPSFLGCGILDACDGDILIGDVLWEVKSGDRQFRQTDIRQLLIYCAMNYAAGTRRIDRFCLANPRVGVLADGSLSDLTNDVAGCDPGTLFDEIIQCVTMAGASM